MVLKTIRLNSNVKLDFLHIEEASDSNVNIYATNKYKPVLNNNSRFLVTFDDGTLISYGIASQSLGYTFSVYKEVGNSNQLSYVARLNEGELSLIDFNVVNNETYRYYIFKEDEKMISEAVISNDVQTCWDDWSLIDLIPSTTEDNLYYADLENIWKLNLNLSSDSINRNLNTTVYNNLAKYPQVSTGNLNYATGSLSCLLGSIVKTNDKGYIYSEDASLLDSWNNFCANGNVKLLRDRKGHSMLVMITSNDSNVDDVTVEQETTITVGWTQIDATNEVAIIGVTNEI